VKTIIATTNSRQRASSQQQVLYDAIQDHCSSRRAEDGRKNDGAEKQRSMVLKNRGQSCGEAGLFYKTPPIPRRRLKLGCISLVEIPPQYQGWMEEAYAYNVSNNAIQDECPNCNMAVLSVLCQILSLV
jgi:hypothetical protein